jgi:hypothetical protein
MLLVQWVEKVLQCQQEGKKNVKYSLALLPRFLGDSAAVTDVQQSSICTKPLQTDFYRLYDTNNRL